MAKFRKLVPMLQTKDMDRTVAWYQTVLGFERTGPKSDGWCCLSRDGVSIMFMNNAHLGEPHATATQYFTVDDVMRCGTELRGTVRPNGVLRIFRTASASSPSKTPMATS